MKSKLSVVAIALCLASVFAATPTRAAGNFDNDVFGRYVGFMKGGGAQSPFKLTFTRSLQLSYGYRLRGVAIREVYRALESGRFIGTIKARGRMIATVSGNWNGGPRSIKASGKTRLANGRQARFSSRVRFGQGTVSVFTRAGGNAVRSSGVKS